MPEITINKDKCIGCGTCVAIAEGVFSLGEDGKAIVADQAGDTPEAIELARKSCPVGAIEVK